VNANRYATDGIQIGPSDSISSFLGAGSANVNPYAIGGVHIGPSDSISSLLGTGSASPYGTGGVHVGTSGSISSLLNTGSVTAAAFTDGIHVGTSGSISSLLNTGSVTAAAFTDGIHVGTSGSISSLLNTGSVTTAAAFVDAIHVGSSASISSLLGGNVNTASAFTNAISSVDPFRSAYPAASIIVARGRMGSLEPAYAPPLFSIPALGNKRRRFELLLPLQFNNGRDVPADMLEKARREIVDQFGGLSCETARIEGYWHNKGEIVRDELVRIWVDVPDFECNRDWMTRFKVRWKRLLRQDELWLVDFEIGIN
jgi:hypothetical protein